MRNDLLVINARIFKGGRVLMQKKSHLNLIEQLHIGHQGVNSMKNNARQRVFFFVVFCLFVCLFVFSLAWEHNCRTNETNANIAIKLLHQILKNLRLGLYTQLTVIDIFHMAGGKYVIYADKYSGWTEVASIHQDAKASTVCNVLRRYFISYGVPEEVSCDGSPS